jgi:raffinose/stachyose/melibiose transport system permease protein
MTQAAAKPIATAAPRAAVRDEAPATTRRRRGGRVGQERTNWTTMVILFLCALTVLLPLYVTISMSLKSTE